MFVYLLWAQNELLSASIILGVELPNANPMDPRSCLRLVSKRWSLSWFFLKIYSLRSFSASQMAFFRSSTWFRRSLSLLLRSSIRRRRSSSFCSRNFCVANACAFNSSSFRWRSSFCLSFSCFIRSSRSFCVIDRSPKNIFENVKNHSSIFND